MRFAKYPIIALAGALALGACADTDDDVGEVEIAEPAGQVTMAEGMDNDGFTRLDLNRDSRLDETEFTGDFGQRGIYNRWTGGDAAGLDDEHFGEGVFGLFDTDRDTRLNEAEWNEGLTGFGDANYDRGTFADWDTDRDSYLNDDELTEGFNRTGLFGEWDTNRDARIAQDEFDRGWFGRFDRNTDTFLDTNEWDEGFRRWGAGLGLT